ncbi:STAS domain-containing protein [Mycobacterium sp.]|uniref:STAS domain-containing protein n=1 Tax=Mycobacterium sp. TaxID=1785 RepID=UPI0025FAEFC3|nr:STAS domain-containing protein [Mycobacterium sp.]MBW0015118.1 STAS domain-containing protein [Mycobacterium sp.]
MTHAEQFREGRFMVTRHREGEAVVLRVSGELDVVTVPTLATDIDIAINDQPAILVVDLTDVAFVSSAALSLLIEAHRLAEPTATSMRVAADKDAAIRPMRITGVDQILDLYPSVAAAICGPHA